MATTVERREVEENHSSSRRRKRFNGLKVRKKKKETKSTVDQKQYSVLTNLITHLHESRGGSEEGGGDGELHLD
jgi:hypothetical protein